MKNSELREKCIQSLAQLNEEALLAVFGYLECICKIEKNRANTSPERLAELAAERKVAEEKRKHEQAERISEHIAYQKSSEKAFESWVNKHKASFDLTEIPSRYCSDSGDLQIVMNYVISQLGYKPSAETLNAICETNNATFIYGFRKGTSYIKNTLKKERAIKGGNL